MVLLSIKSFRNMASILGNNNSTRLLISLSFLLLLAVAKSSTDNGTVELFTSSSYADGETVELLTSSSYPDSRTEPQYTTSSYPDSGTEPQQQTSSLPDSRTEQQYTTSSLPDSGTEQQNTTGSYPDSETEQQYTSSNLGSGTEQQPTSSFSHVTGTEQPTFTQNPNNNKIRYPNNPTIETICTNSSLQVHMNFSRPYEGVAFSNEHSHNTLCSILTHPSSKATEVILELPFNNCGNRMRAVDAGVLFYNTIVVQQHRMIPTRLDSVRNVSCVLDVSIETYRSSVRPATPMQRKAVLRLDNSIGSDLYPDEGFRPVNVSESELYVVVRVADLRRNKDMVVRNCIAHDQRIISNQTNLYQLSNFYGCPDNSSLFGDFTVTNQSGEFFDLMAYAKIKNFTMFANRQLYITCGVTLCVNACQPKCDEDESERYRQFSRIVVKKIVQRPFGATTPSTLRLFTEGSQRVKRSVGDVFSNIFRASRSLLNNIVKENRRQLALLEISTEGSPFPTDLDQNETTTTMTTMESEVFLDEDVQSTGFEVINASTDAYLQEKVSYLKKGPIGKSKTFKNVFSGEVIPLTSEIFVCILFCILFGSIFCFVCKNERR